MHNSLSGSSPLAGGTLADMAKSEATTTRARQKRNEGLELAAAAHAAMTESRVLPGTGSGQSSLVPGTLYNPVTKIKKIPLVLNKDNPKALSFCGFDITVRQAKSRGKKKKPAGQ